MKRHFIFALLAFCALAVASVSCQKDDSGIGDAEESVVNFSLSLEGGMSTKAISDGKSVNQLMYGIFDEDNNLIIGKAVHDNPTGLTSAGGYTTNLSLPNGHTYTAVFWAQNSACQAYTVSDDMKVTVNYTGINNDETRDAFFAATTFTVEPNKTVSVVLKRPFAQINVGAFPFDYEHVIEAGITITKSSATIKKVPNQINLLDGTVSGEVEVVYSFGTAPLAQTPAEDLLVDVDGNEVKETYKWLSMSYILADIKDRSTTHEMSFKFCDETGADVIDFSEGLGSVPATRNWRTNIVGQILTGSISINIKIDPIYENETINSAGLYYNFSEATTIKDKEFAFNSFNHEAIFTTENNNLLTFENVTFSGKIFQIAIGDYRDKGNYVEYTNVLKNVTAINMQSGNGINNVGLLDYMSVLFFLRGETILENCIFKGSTTVAAPFVYNGVEYPYLPYDCGVPNFCNATFNNCEVDKLYAWSHAQITLNNTKVGFITLHTHKKTLQEAHLTVASGSVVDEIKVTSSNETRVPWSPSLIIKSGARVKKLDYNGRPNDDVIIEEGAIVDEIVNIKED